MRFAHHWLLLVLWIGWHVCKAQSSELISWSEYPPIPHDIGFNGSFIGVQGESLIVAGGANFPEIPVWDGGKKKWYGSIYILEEDNSGSWRWHFGDSLKLPAPAANGVSIETDKGLICIGGSNAEGALRQVFRIQWNREDQQITRKMLPDLPYPLTSMGGAIIDGIIYLIGGQHSANGPATKVFLSLDLGNEGGESFNWEELNTFPGEARINPVVVAQSNGKVEALIVLSGRNYQPGQLRPHKLHSDVYTYNPKSGQWNRKNDLPNNETPGIEGGFLGAAPAVKHGGAHVLVFGGAGGPNQHLYERMRLEAEMNKLQKQPGSEIEVDSIKALIKDLIKTTSFSKTVWGYHTITDTWVQVGKLPGPGQVVTSAVKFKDDIVIPGGELSPGVRTNKVIRGAFSPYSNSFGLLNYITLGAYLALIVWMGWYFSKRNQSTDDYFLGGKRVPWWAAGLSIYATLLSAITYLSQPALAFSFDWQAYLGYFTIVLIAPVVILFYLPYYRRLNITTAYEFLEQRFNLETRLFGSLSFILFQFARMGIVVYLPALALSTVIGIDIYLSIVLMGLLAILYTVLGGIEAVIWTDVLQVGVLLAGLVAGIFYVILEIGDFNHIVTMALSDNKLSMFDWRWSSTEVVTWSLFLGSFALNIAPYTTDQAVVQRYLTTSTKQEAAKSIWLGSLLAIPAGLLIFGMGTLLYVYFKEHPEMLAVGMENDQIFPLFIAHRLPAGISGLVIAGIFSASMSSLDSSMHSISTVFTIDFYKRFKKHNDEIDNLSVARRITVIAGVTGTLVACLMALYPVTSLFFLFQEFIGLFGSAVAGVFILGIFTKKSHGPGALTGAACCLGILIYLKYFTPLNFYIYPLIGIPTCVCIGYVVSRIWPVVEVKN
jgi:cyclically-permuted mutarotase family protein